MLEFVSPFTRIGRNNDEWLAIHIDKLGDCCVCDRDVMHLGRNLQCCDVIVNIEDTKSQTKNIEDPKGVVYELGKEGKVMQIAEYP